MASEHHYSALQQGFELDNYRIISTLGHGGFGITYRARDILLEADVAIKEYMPNEFAFREKDSTVYPKTHEADTDFQWGLKRFIQEARTLAKCKHPNIVQVRRYFEQNNTAYLVMDYEHGDSLGNRISGGKTLDEPDIRRLLVPLLESLDAVHNAGYLHRDIKPDNIYLRSTDNTPVLLDFGAARQDVGSRTHAMTAIVAGGYSPFEQYQTDSLQQGPWTDIYALGAVLYRLISGEIPVEATTRINAVINGNPDPLIPAVKRGEGRYSLSFLRAIDWALQPMEKNRPQCVEDWRTAFFAPSHTTRRVKTPGISARTSKRRFRIIVITLAVVAAILAAAAGLVYFL